MFARFLGSFPTEPVTREAHPYLLPGEGDPEISRPSSSGGSAPPAWFDIPCEASACSREADSS
ncbi:hypothetical protein Taro_030603 [Colocasia esculenta]|uniref:Uncharacterized protein n=1 Tax=Colocasia esculenta TaxID=4460 RepID=A0A843VYE4_COLES|nr:hypothetical protein [Colocasia esculenta]